jgi:transposase
MAAGDVLLFTDWTLLRLFPPLRSAWARVGEQADVPVTGRNEKRVLFGTINPRTGHRVVLRRPTAKGVDARSLLVELRRRYRGTRTIWLLLDRARSNTAGATQQLAKRLDIELVWLPKQSPELNAMDQLWRELKRVVAANRQASSIDALAEQAELWVFGLTKTEALRKASVLSKNFWLKNLLQNFWLST